MVAAQLKRYGPVFLLGLLIGMAVALGAAQSGLIVAQSEVTEIPVPGAVVPSYQLPGATPYAVAPEHVRGLTDSASTLAEDLALLQDFPATTNAEGRCLQVIGGTWALGNCAEVAITGTVTAYAGISADGTVTASTFAGATAWEFTITYNSADEYTAPATLGTYTGTGYLTYAFPTPPGRPQTWATAPGGFSQITAICGMPTVTISGADYQVIRTRRELVNLSGRTHYMTWPKYTGAALEPLTACRG